MRRAITVLLVLTLLAVPFVQSTSGPNQRSPDLQTTGNINDVAVAASREWIGAVTQDVGSDTIGSNPNELVWYLWDDDPAVLQAGSADRSDCVSRIQDNCRSHARALDVSSGGTRMVVGSDISYIESVGTRSLVLFVRDNAGESHRIAFEGEMVDVAISDAGDRVAILTNDVTSTLATTTRNAHVYMFNWPSGSSAPNLMWEGEHDDPATALALSPDGSVVTVGAGEKHHWHVGSSGTATTDASTKQGDVTEVAASAASRHWSVAGFQSGEVALYSDESKDLPSHKLQYGGGSTAVTGIGIDRAGTIAAFGFDDGRLRFFTINQDLGRLNRIDTVEPGTGAISHVAMSADGRFVTAASGSGVTLYQVQADGLQDIWSTTVGSAVRALDIHGSGEIVAAAYGNQIAVFEASHLLEIGTPSSTPQIIPGASKNVSLTVTNVGNRPEEASLAFDFPSGWFVAADPEEFDIAPGQSVDVQVRIIVGDDPPAAPGTYPIAVEYETDDGGEGSTSFDVLVPLVRNQVILWPAGPSIDVDPGTALPFPFSVRNAGNDDDSVQLQATVNKAGWDVDLSITSFDLAPSATRSVTLEVTAPSDAVSGDQATVTIQPQGFPERRLQLTAVVGASYAVQLDAPAAIDIVAGEQVQVEVALRNTGNAPDAYDVTLGTGQLPAGWDVAFLTGQSSFFIQEVAAGGSNNVIVIVEAPPGAADGATVVFTVEAASRSDSSAKASQSILANVEAPPATTSPGDGRGTPAPGVAVLLAALGVALVVRRRKHN